jgi:hypothetical protein
MEHAPFTIPFIALYAEIHFRFFRYFPSLIFRKEPEIIFDMPHRIAPGKEIPVILLVNDIDKYPIEINNVTISISQSGLSKVVFDTAVIEPYLIEHPFAYQCRAYAFVVPFEGFSTGTFFVNAAAKTRRGTTTGIIINDNLPTSSKAPLECFMADSELPGSQWCTYGDLHCHSQYSRSHVEFGPPLAAIDRIADAYGLHCIGLVDHSYDLNCSMTDFLSIDENREKWHSYQSLFDGRLQLKTLVIPGEEVSACNKDGKVVHIGGLGVTEYIPGSRDGARPGRYKQPELTIQETIEEIHRQKGVVFAAHPGSRGRWLQRTFLSRGTWPSVSWYRARELWIKALLLKKRLPLVAGNDSHGDFNRYRAIGKPFISIREDFNRYLAFARTGIFPDSFDQESVLKCIRAGATFITSGPFLTISRSTNPQDTCIANLAFQYEDTTIFIISSSTYEFGRIQRIRVFQGMYALGYEKMLLNRAFTEIVYECSLPIDLKSSMEEGYIRAEVECIQENGHKTMAATSPCYLTRDA